MGINVGPNSTEGGYNGNQSLAFQNFQSLDPYGILNISPNILVNTYVMTFLELQNFKTFLLSTDIQTTIKKYYADPMDCIVSLQYLPCDPVLLPEASPIKFCGETLSNNDISVTGRQVFAGLSIITSDQLYVPEYWGNFLDFSPYTNIMVHLPFVGDVQLNADDVIGANLTVKYMSDIPSGVSLCVLEIVKQGKTTYKRYSANMSSKLPISHKDSVVQWQGIFGSVGKLFSGGIGGAISGIGTILTAKSPVEHTGELVSNASMLDITIPYIEIRRPIQNTPADYSHFYGVPANITKSLAVVSGYTEIEKMHFNTDLRLYQPNPNIEGEVLFPQYKEIEEIETLLKSGVIMYTREEEENTPNAIKDGIGLYV